MAKDENAVFAKPVTEEEVPGYRKFVKNPIDLGTMKVKAESGQYSDLADIQADFNLMITNCLNFNKKNPFFLKYAQKMKRSGLQILKESIDTIDRSISTEGKKVLKNRENFKMYWLLLKKNQKLLRNRNENGQS